MKSRIIFGILALVAAFGIGFIAWTIFRPPEAASVPAAAENGIEGSNSEAVAADETLFEIVSSASSARFEIEEVLRGTPKLVVGSTNIVAGQIALDPSDAAKARVGKIIVNARTLVTESSFRDRVIKNKILLTDQHQFLSFTPMSFEGLPPSMAVGDDVDFSTTGQLEIAGVVREVDFDGRLTFASLDRIEGKVSATVRYADFGLTVPFSRSVDAVGDEVVLFLDFVAAVP